MCFIELLQLRHDVSTDDFILEVGDYFEERGVRPAGDSLGWYNGTAFSAKDHDRSGSAKCFDSDINNNGQHGGW